MDELFAIFLKSIWSGIAALGFSIMFNTPPRTLIAIWFGGFVAGFVKFGTMALFPEAGFIISSFLAAMMVGFFSIPMAHFRHVPPVIFSIPSVIPLIPGVFAYRTMLGLISLTSKNNENYADAINATVHNGVNTLFIVTVLAVGVLMPMYLLRKESVKTIRWGKW